MDLLPLALLALVVLIAAGTIAYLLWPHKDK
jgi:hypothetical protein